MPMGGMLAQAALTPSQINDFLDAALKGIGPLTVIGEVQAVSAPGSGHLYFTLADPEQVVNCVTWKSQRSQVGPEFEAERRFARQCLALREVPQELWAAAQGPAQGLVVG
jgi:hypothetical protein